MNPVLYLSKKINKIKNKNYNILTYATHEGYQTLLDKTGHNFYLLNRPQKKKWNTTYRPLPEHHREIDSINQHTEIDFILSQDRFGSLQYSIELQKITRWPIVHMEHVEPQDRWSSHQFNEMRKFEGDIEVYITEHNKNSWKNENGIVIRHGIDTELFCGWQGSIEHPYILYVVNDLVNRDYFCGYQEWKIVKEKVQEKYPNIEFRLVGDNGPLGKPARSVGDLIDKYRYCIAYINTSKLSPIPMSLLEAMGVGCPIVTTANQEVPNVVVDGVSGFCSNNLNYLANGIIKLFENRELQTQFSVNSRAKIKQDYHLDNFVENWNMIFDQAYNLGVGNACAGSNVGTTNE